VLELDCGGQILRTSLALSLTTGAAFRITNNRVNRGRPGLRRQHLTAVRAAARVGNAEVAGDAVNPAELVFRRAAPRSISRILPALLCAPEPSTLTLIGGTHNHGGPPWDFLQTVFLPVLARMGGRVIATLERHGFAPASGGRWTARIAPSRLMPFDLNTRSGRIEGGARALVSNLPVTIAERELDAIRRRLDWPESAYRAETVEADGPGNIVMIAGSYANVSEMASGFGQRGVPAERVAGEALRCWLDYDRSGAPVGEHLADQLLLPLALAGRGSFRTMKPALHTTTNAETIARFLSVRFQMERQTDRTWVIAL
jgi:RNA 3'-terminal phosphate cyclase (ATP)